MDDSTRKFRDQLSAALRTATSDTFQYSSFVEKSGVPREVADQAAASLFGQLCVAAAEDGVITQPEQKRILGAARVLEIDQRQAVTMVAQAKQTIYRQQLKSAEADGVVSAEEEAALAQLRDSLGLAVEPTVATTPAAPVVVSSAAGATETTAADFSMDQESFQESLQYQAHGAQDRILGDIEFFRQFDALQATKSAFWKKIGAGGLVGALVGGALAVASASVSTALAAILGLLGVAALVLGAVGMVFARGSGSLDLEDRRYELLAGMVRLLSADMADDALFSVRLDFRRHNHHDKMQRKGKVGRWNATFFVDPWLQLQGRFVDGTKFTMSMIAKHQDRERTKRSASGKLKRKSKTKDSSEAIVSLKIKGKRYPNVTPAAATTTDQGTIPPVLQSGGAGSSTAHGAHDQRLSQYIQLPPWTALKSVAVEGDQLTLRSTCTQNWTVKTPTQPLGLRQGDGVNWLAMMLLSLYALLNESK